MGRTFGSSNRRHHQPIAHLNLGAIEFLHFAVK